MKRFRKIFTYTLLLLACLEIALHIYNPFTARVRNGDILLPKNARYEIDLPAYPGMDTRVLHSKNSLGFRGPEPVDSAQTRIICMGGSTTECFYLSDGKDWPSRLGQKLNEKHPGIWVNNAGMDGQSSFGNLQMLKQYVLKLKPDFIILMCGLNDMSLDTPGRFDNQQSLFGRIYGFLELPSTVRNLIRAGKAKEAGLNHRFIRNLETEERLPMHDTAVVRRLQAEQAYLGAYRDRIREFALLCKENGIGLIFASQSILYSDETDLFSNVYLGELKTGNINGKTRGYILKMYNRLTYDVADEAGLPYINLAARMPKDSRFFYDGYHFTNEGAEIVADILADEIISQQLLKQDGTHTR